MDHLEHTHKLLTELSKKNKRVLVAFSGGKDSLCVLDLASQFFKSITCFFMYLVDDLGHVEKQLQYAKNKYGVEIIKIPHWLYFRLKKDGVFCIPFSDTPHVTLNDIYDYIISETGINLILTGAKKSDSLVRRVTHNEWNQRVQTPIWTWSVYDVLAYLKNKNIEIPKSSAQSNTGVDLTPRNLKFIHDNYPDDFKKMEIEFPFIRAEILRQEIYG
jgi:phosphoadenosine phosphosulfate reductase